MDENGMKWEDSLKWFYTTKYAYALILYRLKVDTKFSVYPK